MEREKLTTWLAAQIEERGWTIRELGRRAGVSHTAVAKAVSGEVTPSADTCIGLARALGVQPEWMLRLAGRLPPIPPEAANEQELLHLYRHLNPNRRKAALDAIRGMAQQTSGAGVPSATKDEFLFACTVSEIMAMHDEHNIIEAVAKLYHNTTAEDHRYIQRFLHLFVQLMQLNEQEEKPTQIEAEVGGGGTT